MHDLHGAGRPVGAPASFVREVLQAPGRGGSEPKRFAALFAAEPLAG